MAPEVCGGAPAGAVDRYGLRALVRQAAGRLAAAGVTSPQVDARILAEHLLGRPLPLADGADGDFSAAYDALVLRRECREPLQHVIGRMWLRGAELISRPGVFIVRPETEVVAGAAIEAAREAMAGGGGVVLTADLCTGSGAIAACVAEVRGARVVAVEISETAAALARENCERLVPGRVEVIHADATDPLVLHDLNGQVDVVVSNPPYVPAGAVEDAETSRHEPAVALYGGGWTFPSTSSCVRSPCCVPAVCSSWSTTTSRGPCCGRPRSRPGSSRPRPVRTSPAATATCVPFGKQPQAG